MDLVAAQRVVAVGFVGAMVQLAEVTRCAAVVQDRFLVEFTKVRHLFLSHQLADLGESFDQAIDIVACVVNTKRRAGGRGHSEMRHHGLSTMVAGAYCDAFVVQDRSDVVRVDAVE